MPDVLRTVGRPQAGLDRSEAMAGFGADVRALFRMPEAPVLEARDLRFGALAVMELRYDAANYGASAPMPPQDAMLLSLQLRGSARHEIVEAGKRLPIRALAQGMVCLYDLRGGLTAASIEPFHSVNFLLPLDAPEQPGLPPLSAAMFESEARMGFDDPVIRALGAALGPSLARPDEAVRLFVDQSAQAGRDGDSVIDKLLAMRLEARKNKDFAKSDAIRDLLTEADVKLEDTPQGVRWSRG